MASSDLRDVLSIPDGHAGRPASSKAKRPSVPRPNLKGLAREVQNLGGDNPIAIVPEVTQFKKRRLASRKPAARWEMRPFRNSGREDQTLVLRHWRRKETKSTSDEAQAAAAAGVPGGEEPAPTDEIEDSTFAKFNVHISTPQYSDEQYQQVLQDADWSKEETDYLLSLARDFDLRWPLIWDRYEWTPPATNGEANADGDESKAIVPASRTRSMEDLKARYYQVAAKTMAAQKPIQYMTQPEYALHEVMAHFNAQQEKARKEFAINSLARTPEEFREEESLLIEIKRILARNEKFNEERSELYDRLDYPHTETDISAFKSSAGLQNLLQTLMTADKTKKRKSLLPSDGQSPAAAPTPQEKAPEPSRRESTNAPEQRDSGPKTSTPTTGSKKGQPPPPPQQERRKLTDQEEAIYGVTRFDRLGSGPTFRTEKINKLFSHKSNQQQLRMNNTLNELDVPSKLAMPTGATTHQYELLLGAVNSLLDARKVMDKVTAEIKVEEAKKAEREKTLAPPDKVAETNGETGVEAEKKVTENAESSTAADGTGDDNRAESKGESQAEAKAEAKSADGEASEQEKDGEDGEDDEEDEDEDEDEDEAEKDQESATDVEGEDEKDNDEDKAVPDGAIASHKRSASVLSSVSDKSSKRQKK